MHSTADTGVQPPDKKVKNNVSVICLMHKD